MSSTFVTNKYLVTVLVGLTVSMGGYIFTSYDTGRAVANSRISDLEEKVTQLRINDAQRFEQNQEIIRRLIRIEASMDRQERRRGVQAP